MITYTAVRTDVQLAATLRAVRSARQAARVELRQQFARCVAELRGELAAITDLPTPAARGAARIRAEVLIGALDQMFTAAEEESR
jgi:hypothetical protein